MPICLFFAYFLADLSLSHQFHSPSLVLISCCLAFQLYSSVWMSIVNANSSCLSLAHLLLTYLSHTHAGLPLTHLLVSYPPACLLLSYEYLSLTRLPASCPSSCFLPACLPLAHLLDSSPHICSYPHTFLLPTCLPLAISFLYLTHLACLLPIYLTLPLLSSLAHPPACLLPIYLCLIHLPSTGHLRISYPSAFLWPFTYLLPICLPLVICLSLTHLPSSGHLLISHPSAFLWPSAYLLPICILMASFLPLNLHERNKKSFEYLLLTHLYSLS